MRGGEWGEDCSMYGGGVRVRCGVRGGEWGEDCGMYE